ncbi:ATP-dependent protease [Enterococcus phage EFKL]|nr:ATP-dependent protease [Enterococcus phage EFKL]
MPKKYYGEVLGKFFRDLLFVLIAAATILCSLLLIYMVGNGIYLVFGKATLIAVIFIALIVPPTWTILYLKARENFRKDAIRVRQESFEEQQESAYNIKVKYMLPEDIIDQASTICGIDLRDVAVKTKGEKQKALLDALAKNARFDRSFSTSYESEHWAGGMLPYYDVWEIPEESEILKPYDAEAFLKDADYVIRNYDYSRL